MLSIVWWSTKSESSQKKTVASASFLFLLFFSFQLPQPFLSVPLTVQQVGFVVTEAEELAVQCCFRNVGRKDKFSRTQECLGHLTTISLVSVHQKNLINFNFNQELGTILEIMAL